MDLFLLLSFGKKAVVDVVILAVQGAFQGGSLTVR